MKTLEIILKLAFLALSVFLIVTKDVMGHYLMAWLVVSLLLGLMLIFNKNQSYAYPAGYPRMNHVYLTRRIEGVLLLAASITMLVVIHTS